VHLILSRFWPALCRRKGAAAVALKVFEEGSVADRSPDGFGAAQALRHGFVLAELR
jgi:hypothetical protein